MSGLPSTTQRFLFLLSISSLLCRLLFRSTITFLMRCATFTVLRLRLIDTMQAINFGIHSSCDGITRSAFTGTMHQTLIAVHAFEICTIFHTHTHTHTEIFMSSPTRNSNQPHTEHQIQDQHVQPDANQDQYRGEVQTRVQDLLSGNRSRDPHLSAVSTGRLILEGLVEELKIYRLHKEEKARDGVRKERGRRRGMSGREHRGRERRDGEGHRRHHRSSDGERKHRHRSRSRSLDRHASKERSHGHSEKHRRRHHRDRSHERSTSRSKYRRHRRRHHCSPVTEGPHDPNPELMMSGGAGPPGTLSRPEQDQRQNQRRKFRSRSRSRSRERQIRRSIIPCGPDAPKKVAGTGLGEHFLNTYRLIKAEHQDGRRERGFLERKVDGWRSKDSSSNKQDTGKEVERRDRRKGADHKRRNQRATEGRKTRRDKEKGHYRRAQSKDRYTPRDASRIKELPLRPADSPIPQEHPYSRVPTPEIHVQNAKPPEAQAQWPPTPESFVPPSVPTPPQAWPPTPESFVPPAAPRSRSVTPPYPSNLGSPDIYPVLPMPDPSAIPPHPPPPPPNSAIPANSATSSPPRDTLLSALRASPKLRRVASAEKRDNSSAMKVGRAYEETEHSRGVEERERCQTEEDWGKESESEEEDLGKEERKNMFKEGLEMLIGGR
jgi:hypothetical protein